MTVRRCLNNSVLESEDTGWGICNTGNTGGKYQLAGRSPDAFHISQPPHLTKDVTGKSLKIRQFITIKLYLSQSSYAYYTIPGTEPTIFPYNPI